MEHGFDADPQSAGNLFHISLAREHWPLLRHPHPLEPFDVSLQREWEDSYWSLNSVPATGYVAECFALGKAPQCPDRGVTTQWILSEWGEVPQTNICPFGLQHERSGREACLRGNPLHLNLIERICIQHYASRIAHEQLVGKNINPEQVQFCHA